MGAQLKFKKSENQITTGSRIVRYISGDFTISASRHGISFMGNLAISDHADLDVLAEHIARAWQHCQAMRGENGVSDKSGLQVESKP